MLPQTFTIATFNLYNLNLPGRALYRGEPWTGVEYAHKLAFTAIQLGQAQADIVGLQELWHRDALVGVLEQAGLENEFEPLAPADAKGTRIVCAAIVRKGLRVGEPRWIEDFPEGFLLESKGDDRQARKAGAIRIGIRKFSRPVLRFDVKLHPKHPPAQVYVCHFKSKLPTQIDDEDWFGDAYKPHRTALGAALSTIRRTTEAAALRFLLTGEMKTNDVPVIVLGDINDGQHSNTANILTEQPRYLTGDATGGSGNALYTAQTLQEYRDTRDVYYTHVHDDLRESLDHILVSEQFYDHGKKRIWLFDGLAIANDHLDIDDHRAHGSGDHGIVRVRFRYKPAKG
jgi:Endonuclease/Exonuclease/phosphatase family